ncbi:DNA polymerase III subunit gamma/tau [Vibrio sp.]|nr:DNA polymerase III subunit gamma/tau [Vibrio sp.]
MAYLALARKWRPSQFNQVVGQAHVLTALENALNQNRLHHAYLFSGTRGVGKTTIGRLLAKGLNCETGITSTPCGQCHSCQEIDQGRALDLIEIDAASRTKVEDTRELLDNVQYKPTHSRFKVYLIDEVHMLSRHSFNALLKTLEEPPEYVKFLLATTDPQKLPVTILSRCLQFHLKPIRQHDIATQLQQVLNKESIPFEEGAIDTLSRAADGSMRDALSLTDQAIALGNEQVLSDRVHQMLGTLETNHALHLLNAIAKKDAAELLAVVNQLSENGVEWDGALSQLAQQLHAIAMHQMLPDTLAEGANSEEIKALSAQLTPQDVQLYYQMSIKGRQEIAIAPSDRVAIEMILLRMLAFRPGTANVSSVLTTAKPESIASAPQPDPAAPQESVAPNQQTISTTPVDTFNDQPEYPSSQPDYSTPPPEYLQAQAEQAPVRDEPYPEPSKLESIPERSAPPSIGQLRNQLRSHRKGMRQPDDGNMSSQGTSSQRNASSHGNVGSIDHKGSRGTDNGKKLGNESVLDRIASRKIERNSIIPAPQSESSPTVYPKENRHSPAGPRYNEVSSTVPVESAEPYQWKPSKPAVKSELAEKKELTPTQIKSALEHEKTPEMTQKLVQEARQLDAWSDTVTHLTTAKLVEQIALNASFKKEGGNIYLTLREKQAHLNKPAAQEELQNALSHHLNEPIQLHVQLGSEGETPLEIRERLYQDKLSRAITRLRDDSAVQFLERQFGATLDIDSIRPI